MATRLNAFSSSLEVPSQRHSRSRTYSSIGLNAPEVQPCTLHMQYVEQIENAYWMAHFATQSYYVPGRSYDQYQPAFQLGWRSALKAPDISFAECETQLERAWLSKKTSSLLSWREVRDAVQDAWVHGVGQMENLQQRVADNAPKSPSLEVLQSLHSQTLDLVEQLHQLHGLQNDGFIREVIERHRNLLRDHANQLEPYVGLKVKDSFGVARRLTGQWGARWAQIKLAFESPEAAHLFVWCERAELKLVRAYEKALKQALSQDLEPLLSGHLRALKINADKLSWVRKNWQI